MQIAFLVSQLYIYIYVYKPIRFLGIYHFSYLSPHLSFLLVRLLMLKPPDFIFLFASFLICLDLAVPYIVGACSSSPNISKVKDFHHLIVICFLLLSCQNKILSFIAHIILYLHVESLM